MLTLVLADVDGWMLADAEAEAEALGDELGDADGDALGDADGEALGDADGDALGNDPDGDPHWMLPVPSMVMLFSNACTSTSPSSSQA